MGPEGRSGPESGERRSLKSDLQTKLNRAAAAGANDRVGGRHIRRRARATEEAATAGRIVMPPTILSTERVGEVGMVEDIEELNTALHGEVLAHLKFLATERSTFLNPVSRKTLRPMVPKVPSAGGIRIELPFAKHPNASSA